MAQPQPEKSPRRSETGKDERSLIKLPFTLPGRRKRKANTLRSEWEGKDKHGRSKTFYKVVSGSDDRGLPAHPAEDIYIGLLYYTAAGTDAKQELRIPTRELLELMQWGTGGRAYRRLKRSLEELLGLTIRTNALWDAETESYVEAGFHIIERYRLKKVHDAPLFGEQEQQVLEVKWSDELHDYFKHARFKFLEVDVYYSLTSPLAKRLYRWLDDRLYQTGNVAIDIRHLAHNRLEISESTRYPSQIIQKLEPAMEELRKRGIANWRLEDSQTESGKKLVFAKPKPKRPELESYDETKRARQSRSRGETKRDPFEALSEEEYQAVRQLALQSLSSTDQETLKSGKPSPIVTARLVNAMEDLIEDEDMDDLMAATNDV
jgi:hypothetical protein